MATGPSIPRSKNRRALASDGSRCTARTYHPVRRAPQLEDQSTRPDSFAGRLSSRDGARGHQESRGVALAGVRQACLV